MSCYENTEMNQKNKFECWPNACKITLEQNIPNEFFCVGNSNNFKYVTRKFDSKTVFVISYNEDFEVFTIWNALIHKKLFKGESRTLTLGTSNVSNVTETHLETRINEIELFEKDLRGNSDNCIKEKILVVGKNVFYEFCKNYRDYYIYFLEEYNRIFDRHNSENNNDASERERELISRYKRDKMFRDNVLERFDNTCIVCGINEKSVLEAAHIKSVADGGNDDATNGYCLCANHHKLFDSGKLEIDLENREYYFKNLDEDNLVTNNNEEHHLHLPYNFN